MKEEPIEVLQRSLLSSPAQQEKPQLLYQEHLRQGLHQGHQLFLYSISLSLKLIFLFLFANLLILWSSFHHRNKVRKYPPSFACKYGLGMKLNSFHKRSEERRV